MNKKEKMAPNFRKGTFKRLMRYLFKYKWGLIAVMICIVISAVCGVLGAVLLKQVVDVIDKMVVNRSADFAELGKVIGLMASGYVLAIVTNFIYNFLMTIIGQRVMRDIRDELFEKMQKLPIRFFDTHSKGDIMSTYVNDTDTLRELIGRSLPTIFSSACTIVAVFVSMLMYSVYLTGIVLLVLIAMFVVIKKVGGKSGFYFVKQQQAIGAVNGYVEEMISGQKVIKVFNHEEEAKRDFEKVNDNYRLNATKANVYANIFMPIMGNIGYFQYVLLAVVGGALAINAIPTLTITGFAELTLGTIVSFLTLSRSFTNPITQMSQNINFVLMGLAGTDRIFKIMDEEPEVDDGYVYLVNVVEDENGELHETDAHTKLWAWKHRHGDGSVTLTKLMGDITMFDVDFGYVPEKTVLHDITLYAKPGQKVAFVGATGAGKTTITNLINRFYDIADGKIRYDNININKIKKGDLRRSLGMVLQDTALFTGTVRENIRYGRLDATDEEIEEAAKTANAHDFITRLPNGYDTMLTQNGANLSQGQRQLLSIARAEVADAPVMILDEATSSIDTRTELLVQKGMDNLIKGRTVFVIAHRLSTVRNSDVIMVLDGGRIIERGTHDQLIAQKGVYYQLYTGAFELE